MTTQDRRRARWPLALLGALGGVTVLAAAAMFFGDVGKERSMPADPEVVAAISNDQLATVGRTRVFFGHQSVGSNILDGVTAIFTAHRMTAPPIEENVDLAGSGGFIVHKFIGVNEKPVTKIEAFDKALRSGLGDRVDVAMMKLCFLDITTGTDIDALFGQYREAIAGLERDYPKIHFLHVTVPLTTDSSFRNRIKIKLGGSDRYGQGENVARERFNDLMRSAYGDHVFDLAAVESTSPDGVRQTLYYNGQPYYAMYTGYASDLGHLNPTGSEVAATAFLQAIATASPR